MSTKQLTDEALALPLAEKVSLAQALWQSIDSGLADSDEQTALREAEKILPGGTLEMYRRLVQAHGAAALASVENSACTVCNEILSANSLVELNTGKFIFCRSCGRLLYRPESG